MTPRPAVTAVLAFLALAPNVSAWPITHAPSGLQFDLPEGWKTRMNAGKLIAERADGKISLSFTVIDESSVETYVHTWAKGMARLEDLEVDVDAQTDAVNDLQQVYSVGTATLEGKPIQWDLTIVKGGEKPLAVMAIGEDLDAEVVQKVYSSIRRIEPTLVRGKPQTTPSPSP